MEIEADLSSEVDDGLSLAQLRAQFTDYAQVKKYEIDEARTAWRYYHGAQLTDVQRRKLEDRGQPAIIFDRVSRKIDGLVGVVQRLRADPKAFPRNPRIPQSAAGAELVTEVVRSILDASRWDTIEPRGVLAAGVQGVAVFELGLVETTQSQDPDITVSYVDPTTFFYDPRSVEPSFSDARFVGVYRWIDDDELQEIFPSIEPSEISALGDNAGTDFDQDKEVLWVNEKGRKRLVEHWYKLRGQWNYCIYIGSTKLAYGPSPFPDGKGGTIPRYIAWAGMIDQDGDHYGFPRRLKGPQDAINQHRSKAMHIMNSRRIWARRGVFNDVEHARKEAHRPDGFIEFDGSKDDFQIEQPATEFLQQTQYFQDAKAEIENFGPSPALIDTGVQSKSGRALAMMQQNGIAELGPFLINYRDAKLRLYQAVWHAAVEHWKNERWLRLADDPETAQFIAVNAVRVGPDGMPQLINSLGSLDVDIVLDEGEDTTTVMGDIFDTMQSLAQSRVPVPPQIFIEMSSLPKSQKDKLMKMMTQEPSPEKQAAMALQMAGEKAKVEKTQAEAAKTKMETMKGIKEISMPVSMEGESADPTVHDDAAALSALMTADANAEHQRASAQLKRAQAARTLQEIQMAPAKFARELAKDAAAQMPHPAEVGIIKVS